MVNQQEDGRGTCVETHLLNKAANGHLGHVLDRALAANNPIHADVPPAQQQQPLRQQQQQQMEQPVARQVEIPDVIPRQGNNWQQEQQQEKQQQQPEGDTVGKGYTLVAETQGEAGDESGGGGGSSTILYVVVGVVVVGVYLTFVRRRRF
jgi:hypothetical protein